MGEKYIVIEGFETKTFIVSEKEIEEFLNAYDEGMILSIIRVPDNHDYLGGGKWIQIRTWGE